MTSIGFSQESNGAAGTPREAIILLGHGSRVPEAGSDMVRVAERLRERYGHALVEICFMSRLGPHFPETLEKCVAQGASSVVVIPYFLHMGLHVVLDIPAMLQEQTERFPHVKLRLGTGFGFDELLVDLIEKRIQQARGGCDVRELVLPEKDQYPVPRGQCEFVPMPPEEAAQFRGANGQNP